MASKSSFYVTTPIYYVNDEPHIGHAYTTVLADVLARFHRLMGHETYFLTGTDEHGQKIQDAARARGVDPARRTAIEMAERFRHALAAPRDPQRRLHPHDRGAPQEGRPRVPRAAPRRAATSTRAPTKGSTASPTSGSGPRRTWSTGKPAPLRQPRHVDALREELLLPDVEVPGAADPPHRGASGVHPAGQPAQRGPRVPAQAARRPLHLPAEEPVSSWGIPLPFDADYVTYVWFDALVNYYSAVDRREARPTAPWWPADLHLIGKDILTTHAVYWPTMLMSAGPAAAADDPRPRLVAHGRHARWASRSATSSSRSTWPTRYGVDAFRYFLMRDMVVGPGLELHRGGAGRADQLRPRERPRQLPEPGRADDPQRTSPTACRRRPSPGEPERKARAGSRARRPRAVPGLIGAVQLHAAIEETLEMVRATNRYLEEKAPWKAVKTERAGGDRDDPLDGRPRRSGSPPALLFPVMPAKCGEALYRLGIIDDAARADRRAALAGPARAGACSPGARRSVPGAPALPRIEIEKPDRSRRPVAGRRFRGEHRWNRPATSTRPAERARPLRRLLHPRALASSAWRAAAGTSSSAGSPG